MEWIYCESLMIECRKKFDVGVEVIIHNPNNL